MALLSRGCLPCRSRKVKCDEGRPSCRRCNQRGDICTGYRDEASLIFRSENDKAARKSARRRASTQSLSRSATSSETSSVSRAAAGGMLGADDPSDLSASEIASLDLSSPYPWAKTVPRACVPAAANQAVSDFFERYVMYPCNNASSPGFLEHLPCLFEEVKLEGRLALRWAVRAAAYANTSNEQGNAQLGRKALQCYGLALSALRESLADPQAAPDDYTLMTVVVLDLFEAIYLQDPISRGAHTEGMAQILRLRGPDQIYGPRGWSLFRLSHHRLQRQQLAFSQGPLPESEAWLNSLNDELPYVRIEKDNLEINKICERARKLRESMGDARLSADQTLDLVKEMLDLDHVATTWRQSPGWAYRTIHRSEISQDEATTSTFPEFVQLHRDVWIAYEWNYHRTARIIMHEHLLECLDRLDIVYSGAPGTTSFLTDLHSCRHACITIVTDLVDEVLSTVPQSLGDVDHDGKVMGKNSSGTTKCNGVGGYFLLWPIKVIKGIRSATVEQRRIAQGVFERIRECTGMKSALGDLSSI